MKPPSADYLISKQIQHDNRGGITHLQILVCRLYMVMQYPSVKPVNDGSDILKLRHNKFTNIMDDGHTGILSNIEKIPLGQAASLLC